jgi:hypothetical protein
MLKPAHIFLLTTVVLLGACSPLSKNAGTVAYAGEVVDPDAIRCKTIVKTGTRIGTKICRTNRTWDALAARARENLEHSQRTSVQSNTYQDGGASN